jgi:glycogen synthase kinase 3 beta
MMSFHSRQKFNSLNPNFNPTSPNHHLYRRTVHNSAHSSSLPKVPVTTKKLGTISKIGQGAFGVVEKAIDSDGKIVAVKMTKQDPRYKNRELEILQECKSMYINRLKYSFQKNNMLVFVLEYLPSSLGSELSKNQQQHIHFHPEVLKSYVFQLLSGLAYLHGLEICHRDIKLDNILVDPINNILKICDLVSAKHLNSNEESVSYVGSRWYRAPELHLVCTHYTTSVDIWSAVCVIAEMVLVFTLISSPTQEFRETFS